MPPIPCMHCGVNFMRTTTEPDGIKLCNNCTVKENLRNPPKEDKMENTVEILIKCSREEQIEIEEICITQSKDFSRYFLELHHGSQAALAEIKRLKSLPSVEESKETIEKVNSFKTNKGGKK